LSSLDDRGLTAGRCGRRRRLGEHELTQERRHAEHPCHHENRPTSHRAIS
jgi:hypothetical protein